MLSLFDQQQSRRKDKKDHRIKKNRNDTSKKQKPKKPASVAVADADADPVGTFIKNTTARHQGGDSLLQLDTISDSLSREHGPRLQAKQTTKRLYKNHNNVNRQLPRGATTCHPHETLLSTFLSRLSICPDKDKCNNKKIHRGNDRVVDSLAAALEEPSTTNSKDSVDRGTEYNRMNHQAPPSLPDLSQGLGGFVSATNKTKNKPATANATYHQSHIDMLQESNPTNNHTDTTLFGTFQGTTQADLTSTNKNRHVLVDDGKEKKRMSLQRYLDRDKTPSLSVKDMDLEHSDDLLTPLKQSRKREVVASVDSHSPHHIQTPTVPLFVQPTKLKDENKTPLRSDDVGSVSARQCLDASAGPKFIRHADGTTPPKIQMPIHQSRKRVVTLPYQDKSQRDITTLSPSVHVCKRRDQKQTPALTTKKVTSLNSSPIPNGYDNSPECDPYYSDAMVGHYQETPAKPHPPGIVFCSHGDQPPGRHKDESVVNESGCHIDFHSHITTLEDDTSQKIKTNSQSSLPAMQQSIHPKAVPLNASNNRKDAPNSPPRINPTDISFFCHATATNSSAQLTDSLKKRKSHSASDTSHDEDHVISDQFEDADEDDCICINFKSDATLLSQTYGMTTQSTQSLASMLANGKGLSNNFPTSSVGEITDRVGFHGSMSAQHKSSILAQQASSIRSFVSSASSETSSKMINYPCDILNLRTVDKSNIPKDFDGGSTDIDRSKDGTCDSNNASTFQQHFSKGLCNLETGALPSDDACTDELRREPVQYDLSDPVGNAGPYLDDKPSQDSRVVVVDSARSHSPSKPVESASENAGNDLSNKQCELNVTEEHTGGVIDNFELRETTRTPLRRSAIKGFSEQTESSMPDSHFENDLNSIKQSASAPARILRRQRRQPSRLGHFATEKEIERKLNKKKKRKNEKTPVPTEQLKTMSKPTQISSVAHSLKTVSFTPEETINSTHRKSPCGLSENNKPAFTHLESESNGAIDVVDVATIDRKTWTDEEITLLKVAHSETSPTKETFWADIADRVATKTEVECRSKWFALFKTPVSKKANTEKAHDARFIDDFFDATPFRQEPVLNTGSSLHRLDFGSAIKIYSDEICGNVIARLSVHSDDEENYQQPSAFVPKATKSQILNLRREMGKAAGEKKKQEKRKRNKAPRVNNVPRMPQYFYSHDDIDIRARYDDDGGLHVEMPDTGEDDFWESLYEDEG